MTLTFLEETPTQAKPPLPREDGVSISRLGFLQGFLELRLQSCARPKRRNFRGFVVRKCQAGCNNETSFFPKALRRALPCGALGQLAQSSLRRVACTESPAWRYQHGDTRAELLAQSSLHRVTSMEILAQSHRHGDTSMEILAQSHQNGDTCAESPVWSHQHRVTCAEPSAKSQAHRAKCSERSAKSEVQGAKCTELMHRAKCKEPSASRQVHRAKCIELGAQS